MTIYTPSLSVQSITWQINEVKEVKLKEEILITATCISGFYGTLVVKF